MDKAYVSEFTVFMDEYLKQHPEVVKDRRRGLRLDECSQADLAARKEAVIDRVPDNP